MELWLPNQVALNDTSHALIADVEETARRIDGHRPLPDHVVTRIEDELLGERVHNSNAIEGNTLDLRETVMILKQGIAGAKKKREALEARNLGEAVLRVSGWLKGGESCHTVERLCDVHHLILHEIDDGWAGRFREHRVAIEGAKHQPPNHELVPALTERVMAQLSQPTDQPLFQAAWAHWVLARIHPFHDGNGRIARLWQDAILLQHHLTCAVIRMEDRRNYLDSLAQADEGDFNPLVQLVAQRVSVTFDKYLIELGREGELSEFVQELVGEVKVRTEQQRTLDYLRWSRKMEQLRREFELCASRISDEARELRIQVRRYDIIDQLRWENIRSGIGAEQTWFFVLDFYLGSVRRRYYFFFGRHYWTDQDTDEDRAEQRVSLLISEDDGSGSGVRLSDDAATPITIREIFVVGDSLVCRRVHSATGERVYDRNPSPLRLAQDFVREVVLNRLT